MLHALVLYPFGGYCVVMNRIAEFVKTQRKLLGMTQEEFAMRSVLGLRFVRELEQGQGYVQRIAVE